MEKYDVIIIGAGIAGCGLAYNLKKIGYKGSVLIIEKNCSGSNRGYRNTFKEIIKEYNLPFYHKFKGIKFGIDNKVFFTLDVDFYFIDYHKGCKSLYENSDAIFKKEAGLKLSGNQIVTSKNIYEFKYLIDCSGSNSFIKKLFNKTLSLRYWIGNVKILNNKVKLSNNYFYHMFSNKNFLEDFYPLKNKTIQGEWCYVQNVDFNKLIPHKKRLYDKYINNPDIIEEKKVVIPCTPIFPFVSGNIAFLGDSVGGATTSAAEGIRPILDSSKILAEAIMKSDLQFYEKEWRRRYYKLYQKYLVSRMDLNSNLKINKILPKYPSRTEFFKCLGDYPEIVIKRLRNENYKTPSEIRKKFPLSSLLIRQFIYQTYVKSKYALM